MNEESAQVTAVRGRRDDWRTQTDSNAVVPRFSRRAATLNVPTPLVEGAHGRSCRFVCVAFHPSPFLAILRRARSVHHRDVRCRDASVSPSLSLSLTPGQERVPSSLWCLSLGVENETGEEGGENRVEKWTKTNATVVNLLACYVAGNILRKVPFFLFLFLFSFFFFFLCPTLQRRLPFQRFRVAE